ncbi:squalene/phytoene synthase family protein [uncultured Ferrovibrio sp.]|jgi:NADH dehydrogenase [ubiquinone] 1 alpha subcomplex assembly factor 6|uniref:phytoene/squalene synthase family protein n=1 Tax=uncultured Ferrovibrio sp. TaxID=1576913 RepID=UPI00261E706C|nr:squalene/phytoene synthase family protein [uncultured Ferrovibrio sp.]
MSDSPEEYCQQDVRRFDSDRWLTTLFAPDSKRPALLALYAFNSEIARAREAVTQPMIGQIRLQWWREAWEGIAKDQPRRHPVIEALHRHCRHVNVNDAMMLIDARERDMEDRPFETAAELSAYAEASSAPLMRLAAQALDVPIDDALSESIRLAGTAYALVGLLRAVPFMAAQHRVYLPADRLAAAGRTPESLYQRGMGAEVAGVIAEIGQDAACMLDELRQRPVSRQALPALLPASLARVYLRHLARAGYNPEAVPANSAATAKHFSLLSSVWRRRI